LPNEFTAFLKHRQRELGLSIAQLAQSTGLSQPTLAKYFSGRRGRLIPDDRAAKLREALCDTQALRLEFDELYRKSGLLKSRSLLDLKMDSLYSRLRVASLDFPPFAGAERCFVDWFLENCLRLAVVRVEPTELTESRPPAPVRFNLKERIEAVEQDRVDIIYNLVSLQRMKKLRFISTPIRIGINGLIVQRSADVDPECEANTSTGESFTRASQHSRLHAARDLLVYGTQPERDPFRVVTVKDEVGSIYMMQVHNKKTIRTGQDKIEHDYCVDLQDTLDPSFLAKYLSRLSGPAVLICDENTAIRTLAAFGRLAVLILPPNTDQAVIHSEQRKIPPVFYFGLGMRRLNNAPLIDYMEQTIRAYLWLEPETIASAYLGLYETLLLQVTNCLLGTDIYVCGLRRTGYRADDPPPHDEDAALWKRRRETMVEQTARAVAMRCLSLTRRSIKLLPPELEDWRQILTRVRERIQIKEGADRGRIRDVIFYCAEIALGHDPMTVASDAIELLRELVPSYSSAATPTKSNSRATPRTQLHKQDDNNEADPADHWEPFLYLLARELDMDLSTLNKCPEREFIKSRDLGRFISKVQNLLESSRDAQVVILIRRYKPEDATRFAVLVNNYATSPRGKLNQSQLSLDTSSTPEIIRFVAFNLGEMVGLIEAVLMPPKTVGKASILETNPATPADADLSEMLVVRHLHVVAHLFQSDVSRKLIRKMVEEGNERALRGVLIEAPQGLGEERLDLKQFEEAGFLPLSGDRLWYELKRESHPKRLSKRSSFAPSAEVS
jgi:transcriptional regulator with XRE-family HTH domain